MTSYHHHHGRRQLHGREAARISLTQASRSALMNDSSNALKTRSKDTTGRAQKRFFGTQRLDLARSLAPSHETSNYNHSPSQRNNNRPSRMQELDFGFMHSRMPSNGVSRKTAYIPIPTRPVKKGTKSRGSLASSKVLEALDTTDGQSMHEILWCSTLTFTQMCPLACVLLWIRYWQCLT